MSPATPPTFTVERVLLENHLAFTRLHRGTVERTPAAIEIRSASPEFTCALLQEVVDPEAVLGEFPRVRLLPWSGPWHDALSARGFQPGKSLVYMTLPNARTAARGWKLNRGLEISSVRSGDAMGRFSRVQAEGFLDEGDSLEEVLTFLDQANQRNVNHPDQRFWIGSLNGRPVGVTLMVLHGDTAGIYAVTTLPSARRQGVSTSLLAHAVNEALAAQRSTVTLQVHAGSEAERLYRHLGFLPSFSSLILERPGK